MSQWSASRFRRLRNQKTGYEPTHTIHLQRLNVSAGEVINQLINEAAESVPEVPGLRKLVVI